MINKDDILWLDPSSLKPNPKNPNHHPPEQIERLIKLLNYQGWRVPIIVSKRTDLIVAGHGRLEAAIKMGAKTVPVSYQNFEDQDQEYAFMVSDNAIHEWAYLNLNDINLEMKNLVGLNFDTELLGLPDFQLKPWDSDIGAIDNIESNKDGISSKIVIEVEQDQKSEIKETIEQYLKTAGIQYFGIS